MVAELRRENISFQVGCETLTGVIDGPAGVAFEPTVMSLHGAGPSNKVRAAYITEFLAANNICSLRFDFSGHSPSSGKLEDSSLQKRFEEAIAASSFLSRSAKSGPVLIGTSMGGHVAARLANTIAASALILFCPAAYAWEAEDVKFSAGFTDIIRQKTSWKNSLAFKEVSTFQGHLAVIIGAQDQIIPDPVLYSYLDHSKEARTVSLLRIAGVPHNIHGFACANPSIKDLILKQVLSVVSQST